MLQRAVGETNNPQNAQLRDLNTRELGLILPLMLLMLFMGVYPRSSGSSKAAVEMIRARVTSTPAGGTARPKI